MHVMQVGFVRSSVVLGAIVFVGTATSRCEGQTVQRVRLPTFRSFGVGTTVIVPDRGSVYMGGVNSSSRSRSSFSFPFGGQLPGVGRGFNSRGISNSSSTGGISVSATIIDLNELDQAILAEAAASSRVSEIPTNRFYPAKTHARNVTSRRISHESQGRSKYVRLGRLAEADGDLQSAKIFYEMAAER